MRVCKLKLSWIIHQLRKIRLIPVGVFAPLKFNTLTMLVRRQKEHPVCKRYRFYLVSAEEENKSSAVAEMADRLVTIDMGQKVVGCQGLPPYRVASWSIQSFGHNTPTLQTDRQTGRQSCSIGRTVTCNSCPIKGVGWLAEVYCPFLAQIWLYQRRYNQRGTSWVNPGLHGKWRLECRHYQRQSWIYTAHNRKVSNALYTLPLLQPFYGPFFRDHPDEPVPEQNYCNLWCKGRLTEADTLTIQLGATPSRLTSAHLHHHPQFFYRPDALPADQPTASKHWRQHCTH